MCYSRPTVHVYVSKFVLIGLLYCPLAAKKQFLPFFGFRHLVMSTVGGNLRKLNTGAQLQTFPYPTASKSFLYSNIFMVKSGAQTLTFKSVTNRLTDKQTERFSHRLLHRIMILERDIIIGNFQTAYHAWQIAILLQECYIMMYINFYLYFTLILLHNCGLTIAIKRIFCYVMVRVTVCVRLISRGAKNK